MVLDLDETLVHSNGFPPRIIRGRKPYQITWQNATTGQMEIAYTRIRPGVLIFLEKVNEMFEVILFTASMPNYAKEIVKLLDREGFNFPLLTRGDCVFDDGRFIKDLAVINRDLKNVIIIDNFPESYCNNPENGLPIESWFDDPFDRELERMYKVLERLNQVDDVREYITSIVIRDKISMYQLDSLIAEPKKESIFDNFINLMKRVRY